MRFKGRVTCCTVEGGSILNQHQTRWKRCPSLQWWYPTHKMGQHQGHSVRSPSQHHFKERNERGIYLRFLPLFWGLTFTVQPGYCCTKGDVEFRTQHQLSIGGSRAMSQQICQVSPVLVSYYHTGERVINKFVVIIRSVWLFYVCLNFKLLPRLNSQPVDSLLLSQFGAAIV